ncbi:MAG: hypothetical protein U5N27_04325 [Rhizobium sp.]|nr:hypothetical protein [Rhizobium sp.]
MIKQTSPSGQESAWLLEFLDVGGPVKYKLNDALRKVAECCNVPPVEDGTYWVFAAHQMRKFFAVTFQWRYMFPELMALNYQLQQRDRNVTAGYTRMEAGKALRHYDQRRAKRKEVAAQIDLAKDRVEALKEEEQAMVRYICEGALAGKIRLAGPGGRSLHKELVSMVEAQVHVREDARSGVGFNQTLSDFFRNLSMQVHPEGHSICKCGSGNLDKNLAACLREKEVITGLPPSNEQGPDFAYASEDCCAGCPQNIRLQVLMPHWQQALDEARAANHSKSPEVRDLAVERVAFLETVLAEFENES